MKLLTEEQQESSENAKTCYNCEEKIQNKYLKELKINIWKIKTILKLEIIVIMLEDIEVLCIAYVIWNIVYVKKFL